eukprot:9482991-Pyramimonas_sp.AAC.1
MPDLFAAGLEALEPCRSSPMSRQIGSRLYGQKPSASQGGPRWPHDGQRCPQHPPRGFQEASRAAKIMDFL